jgi:hypothetical protein
MYYILYNKKSLKVEHIYNIPLTAKVCDNFYEINGIAEFKGELPKNDWLSVANVREEIETWKEKETQLKTITELEPREVQKVVFEEKETLDEDGMQVKYSVPKLVKETINVEVEKEVEEEIEVEKSKTHIVCDLVAHFYPKVELTEEQKAKAKIKKLKEQLSATDYQAIKYAEGWLTEEEYAPIKTQRQSYRDEINQLEKML